MLSFHFAHCLAGRGQAYRVRRRLAISPAAAVACLIPLASAAQESSNGLGLPAGTPAPDALVEDMEGNSVSLLEVIGERPALIEFWASWCEQCEALQPEIDRVQERFGEEVSVVAVAVAVSQSRRRVRRHVERHSHGYPLRLRRERRGREGL